MRCSEVKRRLNDHTAIGDDDVRDHLLTCPSCAREAEAAGVMERIFISNRGETQVPSLASARKRVESRLANQTLREKLMNNIKDAYNARPKLAIGFALTLTAVLFVTLVPFSYTTTVGYTVSFTDTSNQISIDPNKLVDALAALGYDNTVANYNSNGVETVWDLKNLPDREGAMAAAAAFRTLTQSDLEPSIVPITKEVSGTLYAQVRDQLQEMTVFVDGASSPEEIEA